MFEFVSAIFLISLLFGIKLVFHTTVRAYTTILFVHLVLFVVFIATFGKYYDSSLVVLMYCVFWLFDLSLPGYPADLSILKKLATWQYLHKYCRFKKR